MKILVSACVLGENCKYNGKSNRDEQAIERLQNHEVLSICPEMLAGMSIPRPCAEIADGVVTDENGARVQEAYERAASLAVAEVETMGNIDLVILQSRSPTCGVNQIYDGSFTGNLIPGQGLFAKAMREKGYRVIDVADIATVL